MLLQVPRLDFDTVDNRFNYGGIFIKIMTKIDLWSRCKVAQGIKLSFIADIQGGYSVNPATNLKLYGSYIYRVLILQRIRQLHSMWVLVGLLWDCVQMFLIGILIISAFSKLEAKLKIETLIL
jgi:hypothetical protein